MMIRIRPSIVLFGDSLTQEAFGLDGQSGWASMLASAYTRRADVLNRGFSGYNTRHALEMIPRVFRTIQQDEQDRVLFCTVFLGANDSAIKGERQHVPIDEFEQNIEKIVKDIRSRLDGDTPTPIILITPPPIDTDRWDAYCLKRGFGGGHHLEQTQLYGERVKSVASKLESCHLLDSFTLLGGTDIATATSYLSDGLHLNGAGNRKLFEGLYSLLQTQLPQLAPMSYDDLAATYVNEDGIPMEEPLWTELC